MTERLAIWLQYLLPKRLLTQAVGKLAAHAGGNLTTRAIEWFIKRYHVDMNEAREPNAAAYSTFNEFFTRELKDGARPIADAALVSPVDGAISQLGKIQVQQIFQAKGHDYSAQTLLAGDAALAKVFENGLFATLYLSPKDYHRIHMPCAGRLRQMTYVPGDLFSVNPLTARNVPGLFARNERVVCLFDSDRGPFVLVLVGATIVGSMSTVWHGQVNPPRYGEVTHWQYDDQEIVLQQGEEMGRFLLGSTVVLLFPENTYQFDADWLAAGKICMGQSMGSVLHTE